MNAAEPNIYHKSKWFLIINLTLFGVNLLLRNPFSDVQMYLNSPNWLQTIFQIRFYAAILAILVGISLSTLGLFLQNIFQNSLASPFTLGITPVVSLIASVVLWALPTTIHWNSHFIFLVQFLGSLLAAWGVFFLIRRTQKKYANSIVLIGMLLAMLAGALQQIVEFSMKSDILRQNILWNTGSFEHHRGPIVWLVAVLVAICIFIFRKNTQKANIFQLGNLYAQNLGLDIQQYLKTIFWTSVVLIAAISVLVGPVGFVGLMAPHLSRMILKLNDYSKLFVPNALLGISLCLFALWISHWEIWNGILQINIILSILGVPFTIYLLLSPQK